MCLYVNVLNVPFLYLIGYFVTPQFHVFMLEVAKRDEDTKVRSVVQFTVPTVMVGSVQTYKHLKDSQLSISF